MNEPRLRSLPDRRGARGTAQPPAERRLLTLGIAAALVAAVCLIYAQVARHEFVDLDDSSYVFDNPHVSHGLTAEGLAWSFKAFHMGNWHPLTWASHMLDCQLFGIEPGPHQLVNALFHAANALLLFLALRRLTGELWTAALVAALFAVHPLRVESVAWASERKDVLSGTFWMLTLWSYAWYAGRPGARRMAVVVSCLVLGLLAKPMLVSLPFVLLLLDAWPLGRWRRSSGWRAALRLVGEKLPLFGLVAVASAVAIAAQQAAGAVGPLGDLTLVERAQNAAASYRAYLGQTLWPSGLAYYYPHPALVRAQTSATAGAVAAGAGLALVTALSFALARRRPWLAVGWLWYVGTLVPVIGLLQVGMQARADRYTYVPSIGLYLALAWEAKLLAARAPAARRAVAVASTLLLVALGVTAAVQVGHWRNSRELAEQALRVTRGNYAAHTMLGKVLLREGRFEQAERELRSALELNPGCAESWMSLGVALAGRGQTDRVEFALRTALELDPKLLSAHLNLGALHERQGRPAEAAAQLARAVELAPDSADAQAAWGTVLLRQGDPASAVTRLELAIALRPGFGEAHLHLGAAYRALGRLEAAASSLERAVDLLPGSASARSEWAHVLRSQGDLPGAEARFREALQLAPDSAEIRFQLASLCADRGRFDEAALEFERVLEVRPELTEAHYNLGVVRAAAGEERRAVTEFERALELDPSHEPSRRALESLLAAAGPGQAQ